MAVDLDDYEEESENDFSKKRAKHQDSLNQIFRIDRLWQDTHAHSRAGELLKWNWDLDRVWVEYSGDLNKLKDGAKKLKQRFYEINLKLTKCKLNRAALYDTLMEKETFLRELQTKLGKGTNYVTEDNDMIE